MLDIKLIRNDFERVVDLLEKRGVNREDVQELRNLDIKRRELLQSSEELKKERNEVSKEIAEKNSIMNDINAAFKKDLEADTAYLNGFLYDPFALLYNDDIYYNSSNDEDSVYSFDSLKYIREKYSKDYVCKIQLTYTNYDPEKAKKVFHILQDKIEE